MLCDIWKKKEKKKNPNNIFVFPTNFSKAKKYNGYV